MSYEDALTYPNILKRWQELDAKAKRADKVVRTWQVVAIGGWIVALILALVMAAS